MLRMNLWEAFEIWPCLLASFRNVNMEVTQENILIIMVPYLAIIEISILLYIEFHTCFLMMKRFHQVSWTNGVKSPPFRNALINMEQDDSSISHEKNTCSHKRGQNLLIDILVAFREGGDLTKLFPEIR